MATQITFFASEAQADIPGYPGDDVTRTIEIPEAAQITYGYLRNGFTGDHIAHFDGDFWRLDDEPELFWTDFTIAALNTDDKEG